MARRGLQAILSLGSDEYTWIARNLWTVNTHIVTASVWIMFEQLFNGNDPNRMFERDEMLDIVRHSCAFLGEVQDRSQIARRGVRLIEFLLELEEASTKGHHQPIDISDIIAHVQRDIDLVGIGAASPMPGFPSDTNWMAQGATTWESLIYAMGDISGSMGE